MWWLRLYRKTSGHGMNHQPLAVLTENEYCMIITSRFSNHSGRIEALANHGGCLDQLKVRSSGQHGGAMPEWHKILYT
jgi:hypothetical protein